MTEVNRSGQFPNLTNQTSIIHFCTGSWPTKTFQISSYSLIMFLSLFGNSVIVAVFFMNKTQRTNVHYFIANTAISDLLIPVIVLPWQIAETYHYRVWLLDGTVGSILCKLLPVVWQLSINVSIFSMVAIAVDRFHAVLLPTKSPLITHKTCRLLIVVIWVSSVAFRAHFFYGYKLIRYETGVFCVFQGESLLETVEMKKITWLSWLCLLFGSAIIMTVLYSSIVIVLYRQIKNLKFSHQIVQKRTKRNRRITCMLVIVVVLFYALCTPFIVITTIRYLKPNLHGFRPSCFLFWNAYFALPTIYSVLNPLIYYVFNEDYRRGVRELLCCPWPCNIKLNNCFHSSVSPQVTNNVLNTGQANVIIENIEQ